ncbi:TonB-dependent receptor domain-containing protein [Psychromonas sp. PT13]|uniref:TonB-dependent receptor domain-containing protein n=1 Tax=Psychromonas sp. PT13 TaxID=3439547 RepID=UPI003EB7FCDB
MTNSHRFIRKPLVIAMGTLFSTLPLQTFAEQTIEPEKVQVWGTQINSTSSLFDEDIELKQSDHLSDLLRDEPGIDIGGSHSMVQGINIRGVDELDLNISIDGATQNNNMFHHSGNLLINADILKEVDVNIGTNSVLTGGLSGGVAFETKDAQDLLYGDEKFGARIYGSYGSNNYYNTSTTLYSQLSKSIDTLMYFTYTDKQNPDDGDGNELTGNEGKVKNGLIKLGWDINNANRLELSYDKYNDAGDYYIKTNFGSGFNESSETQDIEYERTTITLNYELDLDDTIDLTATIYENEIDYNPGTTEGNSTHTGYKVLAESNLALANIENAIRYGFEGYEQVSKRIESGTTTEKESANSFAIYLEYEVALTNNLFITPGIRYNHYNVDMNSSVDNLDKTFTNTSFALAAKYLMTNQWTLNASATELFEGPSLRETYTAYSTTFDDDLKAVTGLNTEVGIAFADNNIIGLDHFSVAVNVFETNIDDYIDAWSVGKSGDYSNVGDYEIKGFESSLSLTKAAVGARLTYSHSDSDNKDTGDALRYEVGDSLSLNLDYQFDSLDLLLSLTSQITFDLDAETEDDADKEGYNVHGITARWIPQNIDNLTVTAGIENMFNEQYYSHASFNTDSINDYEPGRNIKISLAYIF